MKVIFVFGSNLAGIHGKGAALVAKKNYGAETGVGEGPTGMTYALPTKDEKLRVRSLEAISISVEKFLAYARQSPNTLFELTRIGCGLAGYNEAQVKPMFKDAPPNVRKPKGW